MVILSKLILIYLGGGPAVGAPVWHPLLQLLLQGEHIHQIMHGWQGWQGLQFDGGFVLV